MIQHMEVMGDLQPLETVSPPYTMSLFFILDYRIGRIFACDL